MSINIPPADYAPTLSGYSGQGAFRFWCQKVLPIVYDDSLSYYELLGKVVVYLNSVIEDVASVENNVEALNGSYNSLQNYVNQHIQEIAGVVNTFTEYIENYFDNLDVQEEINNKLNEMARNGSLTSLLSPIVSDLVPDAVTDWLDENITPTTPVIDKTLSISGAGADSLTVGQAFSKQISDNHVVNEGLGVVYPENVFNVNHVETGYQYGFIWDKGLNEDGTIRDSTNPAGVSYLVRTYNKTSLTAKFGSGQVLVYIISCCFYDVDGNFISYHNNVGYSIDVPYNAYYVRICVSYSANDGPANTFNNNFTISDNETAGTEYTRFNDVEFIYSKNTLDALKAKFSNDDYYNVYNSSIYGTSEISGVEYDRGFLMGVALNEDGSLRASTAGVATTHLMTVFGFTNLYITYGSGTLPRTFVYACFYNADKEAVLFVDSQSDNLVVPENAYYLRLTMTHNNNPASNIYNFFCVCNKLNTVYVPYKSYFDVGNVGSKNGVDSLSLSCGIPFNLFNADYNSSGYEDGWKVGYTLGSKGELVETTEHLATTYKMKVYNETNLCFKFGSAQFNSMAYNVCYYDANGDFIGNETKVEISEVQTGACFVAISVNYGSSPTSSGIIYNKFFVGQYSEDHTYKPFVSPFSYSGFSGVQIFDHITGIGDSLMAGYMSANGVIISSATARERGMNWLQFLASKIGRNVNNLAVGGTTTGDWRTNYISTAHIETNCYLIGLGVNDKRQGLPVGIEGDISQDFNQNANTFYGNLDFIVRQLHVWNSTAHVFVFTIPSLEGGNSSMYSEAVRYICSLYPAWCHCIDLENNPEFKSNFVTLNYVTGHFNPLIYEYFSGLIDRAISEYMLENSARFLTAPYSL